MRHGGNKQLLSADAVQLTPSRTGSVLTLARGARNAKRRRLDVNVLLIPRSWRGWRVARAQPLKYQRGLAYYAA